MPIIKRAAKNEVQKKFDWNVGEQANDRMAKAVGTEAWKHFAHLRPVVNGYAWSSGDSGWLCLADLSQQDRNTRPAVETAVQELVARAAQNMANPQQAEKLLVWPNEEYIFYRVVDAGIDILLTGWGFINYMKSKEGTIITPAVGKKQPASISFTVDGQRIAARPFAIVTANKENAFVTGDDGVFIIGEDVRPGTVITLRDNPSGKVFVLTVADGQTHYDFDVTETAAVTVNVSQDGAPSVNEEIRIAYGGQDYLLTAIQGCAVKTVSLLDGEDCTVKVRDEAQCRPLSRTGEDNVFTFSFASPPDPEPEPTPTPESEPEPEPEPELEPDPEPVAVTLRLFIEGDDGFIGRHYPVTVTSGDTVTEYFSDGEGYVQLPTMTAGATFSVTDGYNVGNRADYTVDEETDPYIFHVPYVPAPDEQDVTVRVEDIKRRPVIGAGILFRQNGKDVLARLDDKGACHLGSGDFEAEKDITALITLPERKFPPITFRLYRDEKEYLLREVAGPQPWWHRAGEVAVAVAAVAALTVLAVPFIESMSELQQLLHL